MSLIPGPISTEIAEPFASRELARARAALLDVPESVTVESYRPSPRAGKDGGGPGEPGPPARFCYGQPCCTLAGAVFQLLGMNVIM